jgi:hypothetical protein
VHSIIALSGRTMIDNGTFLRSEGGQLSADD